MLEQRSRSFSVSGGNPPTTPFNVGLPFFNTATGLEDFAEFICPTCFAGRIDVSTTSQLWGAETNLVANICRGCCYDIELLGGFRYMDLDERLSIVGSSTPFPGMFVLFNGGAFASPAITSSTDSYHTYNQFYGGQFGARAEYRCCNAFLRITGKLALGDTHETVNVAGSTSLLNTPFGPAQTVTGGLFAQRGQIGSVSNDEFAVIPELEFKLGYHLTPRVTLTVSYNFLYWSEVARPGDQVNRNVNPALVPSFAEFNPNAPILAVPSIKSTDFWAQGVAVGLEIKY